MREKHYVIDNDLIMKRWDFEENKNLNPKEITQGSHTKANFICPYCGQKWFGEIRYVVRYNGGCPKCAKHKRKESWMKTKIKETEILFVTNPELEKEWDYDLNKDLDPNMLVANSSKTANWICPLGHRYKAIISNRATKSTGCTYCSGQAILVGFNDLETTRPDLLNEWDYEKNNHLGIYPTNVMRGSHKKVHWICPLGHSYVKTIHERNAGHGCSQCAKESQTSFPEQAIYFYLSKIFANTENRYGKPEIDVYIPSLKFGIEYDGLYAHKNKKEFERKKDEILKSRGIYLIRIKETTVLKKDENNIIYCKANSSNTFLNEVIYKIENILNKKYNLDIRLMPNIKEDRIKIEEQYLTLKKENSVKELYPVLANEWDYDKNGLVKPEFVSYGSSKKYYWKCIKGHSYECSPKDRVNGRGCQICSGYRFIKGINDLETKHPELVKFWDYSKNDLNPNQIKYTNADKFYWTCENGHSYLATIKQMSKKKCCLVCKTNLKDKKLDYGIRYNLIKGKNDLATMFPNLAKEWDYDKNELGPELYTSKSNKKVWWRCSVCGESWKSQIYIRTNCPNCKKNSLKINVYYIDNGKLVGCYSDTIDLCKKMNIDYKKQRGNITSICQRKQKTLQNKYILRHNNDDEFKNLSKHDRIDAIKKYLV